MKTRELWRFKSHELWNTERYKTDRKPAVAIHKGMTLWTRWSKLLFLKRSAWVCVFFCRRSKHRRSRFSALPYFGMISFRTEHMIGTNFFNIACKKLKIAQITQVNQLFLPLELRFAYTGTLRQKGVPVFEASGIRKGRDFTNWSIWKGRRHFGLKYDLKRATEGFYSCGKVEKMFWFRNWPELIFKKFYIRRIYNSLKGCKFLN